VSPSIHPRPKNLADFDFSANPAINAASINTHAGCGWVSKEQSVCLIGDSGTGKSHLLIGLGTAAAQAGHRVRYVCLDALATRHTGFVCRDEVVEVGAPQGVLLEGEVHVGAQVVDPEPFGPRLAGAGDFLVEEEDVGLDALGVKGCRSAAAASCAGQSRSAACDG